MSVIAKRLIPLFIFLFSIHIIWAQSANPDDYKRAVSFLADNVINKKAFNLFIAPTWFPDSSGFWFIRYGKDFRTYTKVLFKPLKETELFNHKGLAAQLETQSGSSINEKNIELENLRYVDKERIDFVFKGKRYRWNEAISKLEQRTDRDSQNNFESKSPNGKWIAYTKNFNLFIRSSDSSVVKQLSTRGEKNYEYASYYGWSDIMEGEGDNRPERFFVRWSPDSKWIQTSICDLRSATKMYLLDWSVDTLYRPRLLSYYRASPGDTGIVYMEPVAFHVESGKEIKLDLPRIPYVYGYSFDWSAKSGTAYISYRERGYKKAHIIAYDLTSNSSKKIFSDSSATNIHGFDYWINEKAGKIIIASERGGWRQLYTLDLETKSFLPLTTGNFVVNDVLHSSTGKDGAVYFLASGKEFGRNPYQQYIYRILWSGKGLKLLTPETANHDVFESPDNLFVVDNYSTPENPNVAVLRDLNSGKILMNLGQAEVSELDVMGWKAPQSFTAVGKDGKTSIYGMLWKPTNFDPSKKYPIIDNSYTGPHTQIVPRTYSRALTNGNQALAELGFVVFMVDGLGTAGRSKNFHNTSYKRLGYGLEDHVGAIRQLAKNYSWLDTTRVGIFGHSAGGYDAGRAMLLFPDFYKVAVASSADHDHRMEKAWWPEMYMGWPVDSAYHLQSNITNAKNLKGKLLITHGGIDENVNPSATFKLAEMLVRADKQFDMLIFPSQRHGYAGLHGKYFTKVRWNYFVKHLLNMEPLWEFDWK